MWRSYRHTSNQSSNINNFTYDIIYEFALPPHHRRSTPEQPRVLRLLFASFPLHDDSASHEKSGLVIPISILPQNGYTLCSVLLDTGSPVSLLSEK